MYPYDFYGRGEWIRTTGLLVPNQALYQAEPRPELLQSSSRHVYPQREIVDQSKSNCPYLPRYPEHSEVLTPLSAPA